MERTIEDIRKMLLDDGINSTLVYSMSESELKQADSYEDYDEYNNYMQTMAYKYDI